MDGNGPGGSGNAGPRGATLSKLAIRGIRSFGPEQEQVIRFDKPLTVISGNNGAGKTTVLECLKFATTGQMPPGVANGQGFVHDPQMANLTEVKAEVKLAVNTRAVERRSYFISRKMQLTQRKTKLEFKQLEGLLKIKDRRTGNEETISGRCSDLDRMVPMFMGVSSAILQSVIFCHQEDSSWPLQESSVLKKKFDDIFDSTRYSKALDEVKKQKKRLMDVYKDAEKNTAVLLVQRQQASKYSDERNEVLEKVDNLDSDLAAVGEELTRVRDELQGLQDKFDRADQIQKRHTQNLVALDTKKRQCKDLRERMRTFELNHEDYQEEDDLTSKREELRNEVKNHHSRLSKLKTESESATRALKSAENSLNAAKYEAARLEEQQNQHSRSESNLMHELDVALVKQGAMELATRVRSALDSSRANASAGDTNRRSLIDEAMNYLRSRNREVNADLERQTNALDSQRDELQIKLAEARSQVSSIETAIRNLRMEESNKGNQLQDIQDELNKLDSSHVSSGTRVDQLDNQIAQQNELVKSLEANMQNDDPRTVIRDIDSAMLNLTSDARIAADEIERLEEQHDRIQDYRRIISSARDERGRHLDLVDDLKRHIRSTLCFEEEMPEESSAALSKLDQDIASSVDDQHESIASATQSTQDHGESVMDSLNQHIESMEVSMVEKEQEIQKEEHKIIQLKQEAKSAESRLENISTELQNLTMPSLSGAAEELYNQGIEPDEIRTILSKRLHVAQTSYYDFMAAGDYLNSVLENLERNESAGDFACPACLRSIDDNWAEEISAHRKEVLQKKAPQLVFDGINGHVTRDLSWRSQKFPDRAHLHFPANRDMKGFDLFRCMLVLQRELSAEDGEGSRKAHLLKNKQSAEREQSEFEKAYPVIQRKKQLESQRDEETATLQIAKDGLSDCNQLREKLEAEKDRDRSQKLDPAVAARTSLQSLLDSCGSILRLTAQAKDLGLTSDVAEQAARTTAGQSPLQQARLRKETIELDIANKRSEKERLQDDWQRKQSRLQRAQAQVSELRTRRVELLEQSRKSEELSTRRKAILDEKKDLVERISRENKNKMTRAEEVRKEEAALATLEAQRKKDLKGLEAAKAIVERTLANSQALLAQMDPEKIEDTQAKLRTNKETQAIAQEAVKRATCHQQDKLAEIEELQRVIAGVDKLNHEIDEISRYHEETKSLQIFKNERHSLKQELMDILGDENASKEQKEVLEEKRRKLERQEASIASRQSELERQAQNLEAQLRSQEYNRIEERYRKSYIETETTKMAASDLDKYYKALDVALMQFHSMKIEEINRRIAELWGVMYRGGDIDRIEIKSEGKTTANRRSYNYRVVMTKGDTQLDMRGRCSAGQRVMAALVIRMALAETFSINCGILSVDEPTVNLDEPNKIGLANALAEVLRHHRGSRFFQLILITHDQDFVDRIAQHVHNLDMEANYYQVTRHMNARTNKFVSRIEQMFVEDDQFSVAS